MMIRRLILTMTVMILVQTAFAQRFYGQKIVGYVPSYGSAGSVDYANLTHAMFAFIVPTTNGGITPQNAWELSKMNAFLTATEAAGTIRLISVGSTNFSAMATSQVAINAFADTLKKFCLHWGFDGVDIDWEGLSTATERDNYTLVMTALEAAIKPDLLLVCTVGFGNYWGQWMPTAGLQKADWLQIMVYDQTGTWADSPFGQHSSYDHLLAAETYWVNRGFSRDKLVMGVPFYGYKFNSAMKCNPCTAKTYKDIIALYPNMTDDKDQTPGTDYTFFNGPATIRKKCQYLIDHNFGGVMIWEMTQDATGDRSLHQQIVCVYSNTTTCRINMPTGTKDKEVQKSFSLSMTSEAMKVNAGKDGDAKFYFYDYSGREIFETPMIHLSEGINTINLPDSIRGLVICKVIINDHYFSEKLYR